MQSAQFALHAQVEQSHWWFQARREILRTLVREILPPDRNTLVVDVGCGTGANLAALSDEYRCLGIDTSEDAIRLARQRFPQVDFVQGFAPEGLGEAVTEAKVFLLTDVLEHVPDDFEMLSRLLAAAAPGAYFLITVPADMALWSEHDVSFGHYRRYTQPRLARVWEGLPVRELLLSHYNSRLYPVVRFLRERNRRKGTTSGAAGTDFDVPSPPVNWMLRKLFAGEVRPLLRQLRQGNEQPAYLRGVSLIALLQRQAGEIAVRCKPEDVEADVYALGEATAAV